ncbi:ABC transporter permease [Wenjunlia tyrosinilytica]|uniref:ABC transporter n=1 Tax=Wenjunlia tyrosinilytica TaxID=1544741 RepID=A0A917ZNG4_9ACTN|nr:ABC transporter permease [Wenjunlia tyrosinilytica]GGO87044.1 ABC transporter [Wenjunlia tyrosinilytica]
MNALTAVRETVDAPAANRRRAVLALARFEAGRLLLHPLVFTAAVVYSVWLLWPGGSPQESFPVLQDMDRETQIGLELIGLAALVGANGAVLRSRRHGTEAHFGTLVLRPWQRTCAHLLSLVPLVLLTAAVVAAQLVRALTRPGVVGHASVNELATGPALVLLFAVVGVLLGRVFRSSFAAPLAVVVVIALTFVFGVGASGAEGFRRLSPLAFDEGGMPLPSHLMGRPAGWHLLYLAGLVTLTGAGAVLVSGGRSAAVKATAFGALAVCSVGAVLQSLGPSDALRAAREEATDRPSSMQECHRRGPTTYCAFPEFTPWTDEWDTVVRGVRGLAPDGVKERRLYVRQRVFATDGPSGPGSGTRPAVPSGLHWAEDDRAAGTPDAIAAGTAWGGGEKEIALAAAVAHQLVMGHGPRASSAVMCDGRGVLVFWLATQATEHTEGGLHSILAHSFGGGASIPSPADGLSAGLVLRDHEYAVVRALLDRPRAEAGARVKAEWGQLTAEGVSTERAAELLGVKAPPLTDDDRQWGCQ